MAKPDDLVIGIIICSMRCDEFLKIAEAGLLWKMVEDWGHKVFGTSKLVPRILRRPKPFNYLEKVSLFSRYLKQSWESPKYWEEESAGQSSGAHWSQSVEVVLRGELGWTLEEINEAPLSKAIADYYKWLENKGIIRLMTDYEIKLIEEMEKSQGQEATN